LPIKPTAKSTSSGPTTGSRISPTRKPHSRRPGQGALTSALPLFFVAPHSLPRIPEYSERGLLSAVALLLLLPASNSQGCARCARPCFVRAFRSRNVPLAESEKSIARRWKFRFILGMIRADKTGSKLCAWNTRHTQLMRLSAACLRSTWQEEGFALPVASPPKRRERQAETQPVSMPSGLRGAAAVPSGAVRP
jgi:hypothetical protein